MARLPVPGSDDGVWGGILNDYLSRSIDTDGTLKAGSIATGMIQDGAVSGQKLDSATRAAISSIASKYTKPNNGIPASDLAAGVIPASAGISVTTYGATGNGTTDDTAAVQAALNAGAGKIVRVPAGTYRLTSALTMPSGTVLIGDGATVSILKQTSSTADGISGVDIVDVSMRDLQLRGPGRYTGTGTAIKFTLSGNNGDATRRLEFTNVNVTDWGRDGFAIATPIITTFTKVLAEYCGRHGIFLYGAGQSAATSVTLTSCYTGGCRAAGYRLQQAAYSTLNACAADSNGIGYDYQNCIGIVENSCGSEAPYDLSTYNAGYDGRMRRIDNVRGITLNSPFAINNINTAYHVTGGTTATINSLYEGSPGNADSANNNPTASLKVDAGCLVFLSNYVVTTPVTFAAGTVKQPQ